MKPRPFPKSAWFQPGPKGAPYPDQFPGWVSGVYAIRSKRTNRILYVGESHTGRLYDTLRRHLATWIDRGDKREHYARHAVEIAWRQLPARDVPTWEEWLIRHYEPRDNTKGLELEFEPPRRTRSDFDDAGLEVTLTPGLGGVPF